MASATQVEPSSGPGTKGVGIGWGSSNPRPTYAPCVNQTQAKHLAHFFTLALLALADIERIHGITFKPVSDYTVEELMGLPDAIGLPEEQSKNCDSLPSRKSSKFGDLAAEIATMVFGPPAGSLVPIIHYEKHRVRLVNWVAVQRKRAMLKTTRNNGRTGNGIIGSAPPGGSPSIWDKRVINQGPWDPKTRPVSTHGVSSLPMPVKVSDAASLAPFFDHMRNGGTHIPLAGQSSSLGRELGDGRGEPNYGTRGIEFEKGVLYEDGRMDLCKKVVGPDHIGALMDSLRPNKFVKHFLLGNNIIGPAGAREIARFVDEFPDRMDTWYLAGNCIDGPSFADLADSLSRSKSVTNLWLKRNPLGPRAARDLAWLITASNIRTLDLDQAGLGDEGVAELFNELVDYPRLKHKGAKLALRHVYLNEDGVSVSGAAAIGRFLGAPHCQLSSVFLSGNPLGDYGVDALAVALKLAPSPTLEVLALQSVGMTSRGAVGLCQALKKQPSLRAVLLGQSYISEDLGLAYNYIGSYAVSAISTLVDDSKKLEYLELGPCAISPEGLRTLSHAVSRSPSVLCYDAQSIERGGARLSKRDRKNQKKVRWDAVDRLAEKVRARYGADMTYARFLAEEKRWLVSDRTDVRKIDSVYRNRDAGLARRNLMTLVKHWEEGDDTLTRVMQS